MKQFFILSICIISLLSCNKKVVNNKAIDGKWEIADFTLIDYNGVKHRPTCEGTCEFKKNGKKSTSGEYFMDLNYTYDGQPASYNEKGTYSFTSNGELMFSEDTSHTETLVTLVYKTKEDLILEIPNKDYFGYYLVFKRIK